MVPSEGDKVPNPSAVSLVSCDSALPLIAQARPHRRISQKQLAAASPGAEKKHEMGLMFSHRICLPYSGG